ncbi:MAG: UbiA prenyltransferase family protein [Thermoplasmatota archaeon]
MEHGQVRAILGRHAQRGEAALCPADPTLLVPASSLRHALADKEPSAQRALAHDYVHLWSRTFRTLAQHLRGRPERAITLFAEEVYPFLRGDRRAARVERIAPREARILLADDLPEPYLCGLLEGFVGLSGATATATSAGAGAFTVAFRVAPADRAARLAQHLATLRLPLLACTALAALTGIGLVGLEVGIDVDPMRAALVVAGAVAAQAGASAVVDLSSKRPGGPLRAAMPSRKALQAQAVAASLVAIAAGALLAVETPVVLLFAGTGLVAGLLLPRLLGRGFGPFAAVLLYGPLIGLGAFHAFDVGDDHLRHAGLALATLPLAFLAGALLFLNDLADRPLDEAGGKRTLAVTLPRRSQALLYTALLVAGLAAMLGTSALGPWPQLAIAAAALVLPAGLLVLRVARELDDPHGLAPARLGTVALLLAVGIVVVLTLLQGGAA